MNDRIVVLGCGPAGLLVAHAVGQSGYEPVIVSKKAQSPIGGAQYLHRDIPGINTFEDGVPYQMVHLGPRQGYAKKVYGDPEAETSWTVYKPGLHYAWNLRAAYDRLWQMYEGQIVDSDLTPEMVRGMTKVAPVFSTIPAIALAEQPYDGEWNFASRDVLIAYGQDLTGVQELCGDMEIVCNGYEDKTWYRISNLFGWQGVEYPPSIVGSLNGLARVSKPLETDWPGMEGVWAFGRYGQWKKGVLTHHAYEEALAVIEKEQF